MSEVDQSWGRGGGGIPGGLLWVGCGIGWNSWKYQDNSIQSIFCVEEHQTQITNKKIGLEVIKNYKWKYVLKYLDT